MKTLWSKIKNKLFNNREDRTVASEVVESALEEVAEEVQDICSKCVYINTLKKDELVKMAKEMGIKITTRMTKDQVKSLLKAELNK